MTGRNYPAIRHDPSRTVTPFATRYGSGVLDMSGLASRLPIFPASPLLHISAFPLPSLRASWLPRVLASWLQKVQAFLPPCFLLFVCLFLLFCFFPHLLTYFPEAEGAVGISRKFQIGVCRERSQTLTLIN